MTLSVVAIVATAKVVLVPNPNVIHANAIPTSQPVVLTHSACCKNSWTFRGFVVEGLTQHSSSDAWWCQVMEEMFMSSRDVTDNRTEPLSHLETFGHWIWILII